MLSSAVRLFTRHPAEQGESYLRHMRVASGVGAAMVIAGLACLLHAVFPFWFKTTASRTLTTLTARVRRTPAADRGDGTDEPAATA